jgi:enterochelin esterase-like enzyme
MKRLFIMIAALAGLTACKSANEYVVGNLEIFEGFQSKFVESRTVRVWTPEDYDPKVKYDVIYMHDGQNLFDASLTWNQQEWGVDEVLTDLMAKGEIRP